MTNPDELERAVAAAEEWIAMAETCEIVGPSGVLRYPPICNSEFDALRLILAANRKMRKALERIADPRNIHFAGDAQVVARSALSTKEQPNV
jgi:hypothetical protein